MHVNFVVNINLANSMVEGSVAALRIAYTLMFFALGVIGQSVGSAVFPSLAALWAEGDLEGFKTRMSLAMRNVLFMSFPATVIFVMLGEPIFSIFERGEWTGESTQAAAWALGFYALGIAGFTLLEVLSRAFYALEDTLTPVVIGTGAMVTNIVLNLIFIQFIGDPNSLARGAFAGLALANALTTLVESVVLWWLISRRLSGRGLAGGKHDLAILGSAGGSLLAALIMGICLWLLSMAMPAAGWMLAIAGSLVGGLVFFAFGYLFNLGETRALLAPFIRRLT